MDGLAGHQRYLWAIAYRMTASAPDADEIVQQTFAQALEHPPQRELRPWLVRICVNLAHDVLRRRRRTAYPSVWLPTPVPDEEVLPAVEVPSTEARYDLYESCSMAFLVALEALTPRERAVMLLRDVFDYSVRETAAAIDTSEGNVKVLHHRARKKLDAYDHTRAPVDTDEARDLLIRFMSAIGAGDVAAAEALLAADAISRADGGGVVPATVKPSRGAHRIATSLIKIARLFPPPVQAAPIAVNGQAGLYVEFPGFTNVVVADVRNGRITALYSVVAPAKLGRVTAIPRS